MDVVQENADAAHTGDDAAQQAARRKSPENTATALTVSEMVASLV